MSKLTKNELLSIFKLKVLLFNRFSFSDNIPIHLDSKIIPKLQLSLFARKSNLPVFFENNDSILFKFFSLLLSQYKMLEFSTHYSLSEFSTMKKKFVDRRENPPRGADFDFLLEPTPMLLSSIVRAKVPVRLFVNKTFFTNNIYKRNLKRFSKFARIEPYERLLSINFYKKEAYFCSFLNYLVYKNGVCGIKGISLFNAIILANFLPLSNTFGCSANFKPFLVKFFNLYAFFFATSWSFFSKPNYSGLVMFRDFRKNVTNVSNADLLERVGQMGVRHFGWHYPFRKKPQQPNKNSDVGWRNTKKFDSVNFFWLTKKMLSRRYKSKQLYKPYYNYSVYPRFLPQGACEIASKIVKEYCR